jgi:16S rRNA (cytidine1402-2'-O)-methyltransferase
MRQQTFVNGKPTLYLVATPVGNLMEFTPRAIEVLKSVSVIGCEDTRTSKVLLNHFEIETPLLSYHKFNEKESVERFLNILDEGKDIALISDAGYPLVSDPGSVLVNEVISKGYNVTTISGASAFLNALVASGFSLSRFTFIGFLDSKSSARKKELEALKKNKETLVFYESPHRVADTLADMFEIFGNRQAAVVRELTKKFEESRRGLISELLDFYVQNGEPKGEVVLVVARADASEQAKQYDVVALLKKALQDYNSVRDAVDAVAFETGLDRRKIYKQAIEIKNG